MTEYNRIELSKDGTKKNVTVFTIRAAQDIEKENCRIRKEQRKNHER